MTFMENGTTRFDRGPTSRRGDSCSSYFAAVPKWTQACLADRLRPTCRSRTRRPLAFDRKRRFRVAEQEESCSAGDEVSVGAPDDVSCARIEAFCHGRFECRRPHNHGTKAAHSREVIDDLVTRGWCAFLKGHLMFWVDDWYEANL